MYKLRCDIAKARAELLADSAMTTYHHKFGNYILETTLITDPLGLNHSSSQKDWSWTESKREKLHSLLTNF